MHSSIVFAKKNYKGNPMIRMYDLALEKKNIRRYYVCTDANKNNEKENIKFIQSKNVGYSRIRRIFLFISKKSNPLNRLLRFASFLNYIIFYIIENLFILTISLFKTRGEKIEYTFSIDADYLLSALLFSKFKKSTVYYSLYEIWPEQIAPNNLVEFAEVKARTFVEKILIKKFDKLIATDTVWVSFFSKRYSIDKNKFHIIPVCPDRSKLSLSANVGERLKFYYHGAAFLTRGIEDLILSFKSVTSADLYLRIVGEDLQKISEIISKNNINNIYILEPVELEALVDTGVEFDVGIILARPDTINGRMCTGFKLFEYLNSGLCMIGPSSHPLKRFFRINKNGFCYGWPSVDNITKIVNNLINNHQDVVFAKMQSQLVSNEFNSDVMIRKFQSILI